MTAILNMTRKLGALKTLQVLAVMMACDLFRWFERATGHGELADSLLEEQRRLWAGYAKAQPKRV